jgi:sodium-dependent dicarboxylate transporter 2/3/5
MSAPKKKWILLSVAVLIGIVILLLPRPEGTRFRISGDADQRLIPKLDGDFEVVANPQKPGAAYTVVLNPSVPIVKPGLYLKQLAAELNLTRIKIEYINGLSPAAKRFLAVLAVLVFLFIAEPIPLEITAICIGVFIVVMGVGDVKEAWAPYMHPVVVFIMCCLIFAISLDKVGITKRLGYFIIRRAGNSVTKFTFIITISLGWASSFMHDAAACAIGIVTMLPMMRAAGIEPFSTGSSMRCRPRW